MRDSLYTGQEQHVHSVSPSKKSAPHAFHTFGKLYLFTLMAWRERMGLWGAVLTLCQVLLLWAAFSASAHAQYTNCPTATSVGQQLALNITDGECVFVSSVPTANSDGSEDYILIEVADNSGLTNFEIFQGGSDPTNLSFSVDGASVSPTVTTNCSTGCNVTGSHGASPISFTYTDTGNSGQISISGAPEISVSSSVGGAVADGGTDAQGFVAAGTPQTVTYTVT
ncbi:hypothetical protein SCD92_17440, partial [Gilvimarinus sp. SDUM040013]